MGYQFLFESVLSSGPITLTIFVSLILLSVYTWGILISRILQFKQEEQESRRFFLHFDKESDLNELYKGFSEGEDPKFLVQRGLTAIFCETYREVLRTTHKISGLNFLDSDSQAIRTGVEDVAERAGRRA